MLLKAGLHGLGGYSHCIVAFFSKLLVVFWATSVVGSVAQAELPDIRDVPPDLVIPPLSVGPPAPGVRVKQFLPEYKGTQIYHVVYLPRDWRSGVRYPVLVEYAGNGGYTNTFGDTSSGLPEGSKLGYGLSGGQGFIWVCLPYVDPKEGRIALHWWGDVAATVAYCKQAVRLICDEFGGDPAAVILTGFSRGAIACGYLGLHDDEIAGLWQAFIPYSHYDGDQLWPYPASDAASAIERMKRLKGRPSFICQEVSIEKTRQFIEASGVAAPFTFQAVPFRNHTDAWVLRESPARAALRQWVHTVLSVPPGHPPRVDL